MRPVAKERGESTCSNVEHVNGWTKGNVDSLFRHFTVKMAEVFNVLLA